MHREAPAQRKKERDEDQRKADRCDEDVRRQQHPKVDGARGGISLWKEDIAVQHVVGDVGNEKRARSDERAEHAVAVRRNVAASNEAESCKQKDRADRIENRVERRKKREMRTGDVGWRMEVDDPRQKRRRERADADDAPDNGSWCAIAGILR